MVDIWPQSLRTATSIPLCSPVPMVMLQGADGVMPYNDDNSVFAGGLDPEWITFQQQVVHLLREHAHGRCRGPASFYAWEFEKDGREVRVWVDG